MEHWCRERTGSPPHRCGSCFRLKTSAARRDVVVMPELAATLRRHRLASFFSGESDLVFCSDTGRTVGHRNLTARGLTKATKRAGLDGVTFHVLRHTFASILIDQGHDVVFVSRQLGHANPSITLKVSPTSSMPSATPTVRASNSKRSMEGWWPARMSRATRSARLEVSLGRCARMRPSRRRPRPRRRDEIDYARRQRPESLRGVTAQPRRAGRTKLVRCSKTASDAQMAVTQQPLPTPSDPGACAPNHPQSTSCPGGQTASAAAKASARPTMGS